MPALPVRKPNVSAARDVDKSSEIVYTITIPKIDHDLRKNYKLVLILRQIGILGIVR